MYELLYSYYEISNNFWNNYGPSIDFTTFSLGVFSTFITISLYTFTVRLLLSDELTRWVFYGYLPIGIIVITDLKKKNLLITSKIITKDDSKYEVWTLPQGEIDVSNLRIAFERIIERSTGFRLNDYKMSRKINSAGTIKIPDLFERPISHPGISIRNKNKPIGKGYYYTSVQVKEFKKAGKDYFVNDTKIISQPGAVNIKVLPIGKAIKLITDSNSGRDIREKNKLKQQLTILGKLGLIQ